MEKTFKNPHADYYFNDIARIKREIANAEKTAELETKKMGRPEGKHAYLAGMLEVYNSTLISYAERLIDYLEASEKK